MGSDGHTASIFPGPDIEEAFAAKKDVRAIGVAPDPMPPEAPVNRVTLTAQAICEARTAMVVISGGAKKAVLENAIADGARSVYPIGKLFDRLTVPVDIYWLAE
jgi:6-phosphogluconolactonase